VRAVAALALLVGLAAPTRAEAAEVRSDEEGAVAIGADETIEDTVFLSGKTASVAGVVDGDVFAAAERVEITGTVRGNLYCAAETVRIAGEITGNVHAIGGHIDVDTKVGGSGFIVGQSVTLAKGSEVVRGSYLAGESIRVNGRVGRGLYFPRRAWTSAGAWSARRGATPRSSA
jgi:hypothetical protein